jgi:uncharacterized small protein (TIGR04563 family)
MDRYNKNRQSCFFPEEVLAEMRVEAERQERSLSRIAQQAWLLAKEKIKTLPSMSKLIQDRADAAEADQFYEGRG